MLSCACLYNKNFHYNFRKTVKANQLDLVEKKLKTSFQIAKSAQAAKMTSLDFGLPLTIMWTLDCFAIEEFSKLGEVFMRYITVSIRFLCRYILFDFSVDSSAHYKRSRSANNGG